MEKSESKRLLSLIGVAFLFVMSYQVIDPVLTLYMKDVGATELEVGVMLAALFLVGFVSRIPSGLIADRFGRKNIILLALISQFLSLVFLYFVYAPFWFYFVLSFLALPMSLFWPSGAALASDMSTEEKRGELMGRYFTAFGLAMFLGPLLCSFLTLFLDYRSVLLVLLPFPLISVIIFFTGGLTKLKSEPEKKNHAINSDVFKSIKSLLKSRNVKAFYAIDILTSVPTGIFAALFSIYARDSLLLTPSAISLLFTARGFANVSIRMPIGKISDSVGRKKPLIISLAFYAIAFLVFSVTTNYHLLVFAMVLYGLGWGMRAACSSTFIVENVERRESGLALSIMITMVGIGEFLGSTLGGIISTFLSSPDILKISTILYFLAIIIFHQTITEKKKSLKKKT